MPLIVKLCSILGLVGSWWIFYLTVFIVEHASIIYVFARLDPLDFILLFLLFFPLVSFSSALWLLFRPATEENKGILGLISMVGGIFPTFFFLAYVLPILVHGTIPNLYPS